VGKGRKVSADDVLSYKPDVFILAAGAEPVIPDIPGVDKPHVCTTLDILSGNVEPGDDVVIIGGGLVGGEVAELLVEKGKRPVIVKKSHQFTGKPAYYFTRMLIWRLNRMGVRIITGADVLGIEEEAVRIKRFGNDEKLKADTVVIARGMRPDRSLLDEIGKGSMEVYAIGDCDRPRRILEALTEGAQVGLKI